MAVREELSLFFYDNTNEPFFGEIPTAEFSAMDFL